MVVRNHVMVGESGEIHLTVPQEWKGREVEILLMPPSTVEREAERARFDAFVAEHGTVVGDWGFSREEANDRGLS